jgi:large subunit ribosomal protein L24
MVIAGSDKGKTGKILKILKKERRVVVEGLNKKTKHVKGRDGQPGEIVLFSAPFDISNIAIVDPKTKKPSRIGYRIDASGEKVRISKKSGSVLEKITAKKEVKNKVKA